MGQVGGGRGGALLDIEFGSMIWMDSCCSLSFVWICMPYPNVFCLLYCGGPLSSACMIHCIIVSFCHIFVFFLCSISMYSKGLDLKGTMELSGKKIWRIVCHIWLHRSTDVP